MLREQIIFVVMTFRKEKIKKLLNDANRVSITTDLWTSDQQVIQYMVMTCHFVDSTLSLQKRILNFLDVPPPHTALVISDVLHKCLVEWEIEKKDLDMYG